MIQLSLIGYCLLYYLMGTISMLCYSFSFCHVVQIICPLSANQIFIYKGFLMNEAESLVKMMEDDKAVGGNRALFLKNLVIQVRILLLEGYYLLLSSLNYLSNDLY